MSPSRGPSSRNRTYREGAGAGGARWRRPNSAEFKALGREDVNDIESILADDDIDFGAEAHFTPVGGDALFTWDYERTCRGRMEL